MGYIRSEGATSLLMWDQYAIKSIVQDNQCDMNYVAGVVILFKPSAFDACLELS